MIWYSSRCIRRVRQSIEIEIWRDREKHRETEGRAAHLYSGVLERCAAAVEELFEILVAELKHERDPLARVHDVLQPAARGEVRRDRSGHSVLFPGHMGAKGGVADRRMLG